MAEAPAAIGLDSEASALKPADVGKVERMVALRSFGGWQGLSSSELATLAEISRPRFARAGTRLVGEGQDVTSIYLVVSGMLVARRHGHELGQFGVGAGVGGLAAFSGQTDGYEVDALEDTVMIEMRIPELEEVFEDRFPILLQVLRELSRQILELRQQLKPLAGFPAECAVGVACPARRLDLVERMIYLRKSLAIAATHIDSVAVLAKTATEVRLAPGDLLWNTGDLAESMVVILCGRVRCESPEGHRFDLGAGDIAGSLDMIAGIPRWYDCKVVDGVVGLSIQRDVNLDVWEDHPDLGMRMMRAFSGHLLRLLEKTAE